jgi:large subunit ribosomal protein L18
MAEGNSRRTMSLLRHRRLRSRVRGTGDRPRLAVYRSSRHLYTQLIDDERGHTLAAANTLQVALREDFAGKSRIEIAQLVGRAIAEKAKAAGVSHVVFDRGGFKYHGRIKALADAAREAGLEF